MDRDQGYEINVISGNSFIRWTGGLTDKVALDLFMLNCIAGRSSEMIGGNHRRVDESERRHKNEELEI
jgi:hypothetical protein